MKEIITMCCCEKVRDNASDQPGEMWQDVRGYLAQNLLSAEEIHLSHTYCPECLERYRSIWTAQNENMPGARLTDHR